MKKLFFSFLFVFSFAVVSTSCHRDDSMIEQNVEKDLIQKNPDAVSRSVVANITGCSSPEAGIYKTWGSGYNNPYISLPLHSNSGTNIKYIWRASNVATNGKIPSFKFRAENRANYPITVRAVGVQRNPWTGQEFGWEVINIGKCIDLNSVGSSTLIDLISVNSKFSYVDFEVILLNRTYAAELTGSNAQLSRISVPVKISMCRYTTLLPCTGI